MADPARAARAELKKIAPRRARTLKYPQLSNYLGCRFSDRDSEDYDLIIKTSLLEEGSEIITAVLNEAKCVLTDVPFPAKDISNRANYYYEDENKLKEWFIGFVNRLERQLKSSE
jgi:hypothetical protein